ncbi:hypothetical protein MIR68_001506 [Amoeboaphelidium protococcarum]|nr:hypothetical protein MIR68_001506 [Amoeboaphelidium protococcarum]
MATGCAEIRVSGNQVSSLAAHYPLKLHKLQSSINTESVYLYLITYGGGLLSGDHARINVEVKNGGCVSLYSQASTKIYKQQKLQALSPSSSAPLVQTSCSECSLYSYKESDKTTRQDFYSKVQSGSEFYHLPEPITPFADSRFSQCSNIIMDLMQQQQAQDGSQNSDDISTSSGDLPDIIWLDWMSSGRSARGERWIFDSFRSETKLSIATTDMKDVHNGECLIYRDCYQIQRHSRFVMKDQLNVMGTILLVAGPKVSRLIESIKDHIDSHQIGTHLPKQNHLMAYSPIIYKPLSSKQSQVGEECVVGIVVKFAFTEVHLARQWILNVVLKDYETITGRRNLFARQL